MAIIAIVRRSLRSPRQKRPGVGYLFELGLFPVGCELVWRKSTTPEHIRLVVPFLLVATLFVVVSLLVVALLIAIIVAVAGAITIRRS